MVADEALRIGFVTFAGFPEVAVDDQPLAEALRELGVEVRAIPWQEKDVNWSNFDQVLLRSCWDYHLHLTQFERWLDLLEQADCQVRNPLSLVRWNMDKHYLLDLDKGGVDIVPTEFLEPGQNKSLGEIMERRGWHKVVIKPAVSASAHQTWVIEKDEVASRATALSSILAEKAFMMQPFIEEIPKVGEWSLMYFGGAFSHAVLKTPQKGDFRVQSEFGGTREQLPAPEAGSESAADILSLLSHMPDYMRVDGVMVDGCFQVIELELIEPELFFLTAPDAAKDLARRLVTEVRSG